MNLLLVVLLIIIGLLVIMVISLKKQLQNTELSTERVLSISQESNYEEEVQSYEDDFNDDEEKIQSREDETEIIREEIKLQPFINQMSRWAGFLDQRKKVTKKQIIKSLSLIQPATDIENLKIFFLSQVSELILSNGYNFQDFEIHTDLFGHGPSEVSFIWFNVGESKLMKDHGDLKVFQVDFIFTLKDGSQVSLPYEYYDDIIMKSDTLTDFQKHFKQYIYYDFEEPYHYYSVREGGKFRIILDDLFQYIDFVGKSYFNKKFSDHKFKNAFEVNIFIDSSWQIDKAKYFKYVSSEEFKAEQKTTDKFTEALNIYYDNCGFVHFGKSEDEAKDEVFKAIALFEELLKANDPFGYLTMALLYLDGEFVLKNTQKAKEYLQKSYDLGLKTPSIKIWNENKLDNV